MTSTHLFIKAGNFHMVLKHWSSVSVILACSEDSEGGE